MSGPAMDFSSFIGAAAQPSIFEDISLLEPQQRKQINRESIVFAQAPSAALMEKWNEFLQGPSSFDDSDDEHYESCDEHEPEDKVGDYIDDYLDDYLDDDEPIPVYESDVATPIRLTFAGKPKIVDVSPPTSPRSTRSFHMSQRNKSISSVSSPTDDDDSSNYGSSAGSDDESHSTPASSLASGHAGRIRTKVEAAKYGATQYSPIESYTLKQSGTVVPNANITSTEQWNDNVNKVRQEMGGYEFSQPTLTIDVVKTSGAIPPRGAYN